MVMFKIFKGLLADYEAEQCGNEPDKGHVGRPEHHCGDRHPEEEGGHALLLGKWIILPPRRRYLGSARLARACRHEMRLRPLPPWPSASSPALSATTAALPSADSGAGAAPCFGPSAL